MTRITIFAGLIALIVALPASHILAAKPEKVSICHVNSSNSPGSRGYDYFSGIDYTDLHPNDGIDWNRFDRVFSDFTVTTTYNLGRVIEVDASAVDAHLAHGDSLFYFEPSDAYLDFISTIEDTLPPDSSSTFSFTSPNRYSYLRTLFSREWFGTNAGVGNANCAWNTFERVDNR